jgi:hypothetical protein
MHALLRCSRAVTPWGLVVVTAAVTVGLLLMVARWPAQVWPLHGSAVGLLAGVSAWSLDERCATVVDVAPRALWWRTVARAPATVLLVSVWVTTHVLLRDRLPDHLGVLVLQGAGASIAGVAAASWRRASGVAEPGQSIALSVCPVAVALALAKPWSEHAPLFPVWPHENWSRATVIWTVTGIGAVVALGSALWRDGSARR